MLEATAGCRFGLILQLKRFLNFNTNSGFAKSHSPRIFLYTTSKPVSKQNASAKIILLWLKPQLPKMSLSEFLEERSWVHNPNPKCKQNSWFILIITGLLCYYLAFQRSILIGNDRHSFAFYKPYIEHFGLGPGGTQFETLTLLRIKKKLHTVEPVLSGTVLSGHLSNGENCVPLCTVISTSIKRSRSPFAKS